MFRQHVKHYHKWLHSSIHLKTKFSQSSPVRSGYKALQKDQALASCIRSLLSKNAIERVETVKSFRFYSQLFLVPKPHQRWRPVIDLSKLNTFLLVERFKMETPGWVSLIDLSDAYLYIPIHPNSRKYLRFCHKSQVFQFTTLPFRLAKAPQAFTMVVKEVKLMTLTRGIRLHQYLDDWLIRVQSQEEAQVNTQTVVDLTQSLGWIINQEKSEAKPTQVFSFVGYEYHLDSALVKPTQERFDPTTQVNTCFDCKMFDVTNWVARLNGENGPTLRDDFNEALSVSPQGVLEISSVVGQPRSLGRNHFSTPRMVAESHKRDERCRPSSQRPQYTTLYRHLKRRLGRSLRASLYKGSVVRQEKRATHKCSRAEGSFSGPSKVQGPVSKPNSVGCYGQLNSSSLLKQTRSNPLSGDVHSSVEDHDLVPSLPDNLESQTHSRVSECDGQSSVQVEPSPVNRMVTASAGVQTDLSKVVHISCRSICHSPEPQSSTVHISSARPKCLGHRCSQCKLVGSHCLCLPSHGSSSQGDKKIRQSNLIIVIAQCSS